MRSRGGGVSRLARFGWVIAVVLWFAVLASAGGAIYTRHRSRELFVELERLRSQRDGLETEWGQLQLEQSAWSAHAFVERVATTRLQMMSPDPPRTGGDGFRLRALFLFAVLLLGAAGLLARAVDLQLVEYKFLVNQGDARFL